MFERNRVMKKFKREVDEIVEIIHEYINKEDFAEALSWYNELLAMKNTWEEERRRPGTLIINDPWVRPRVAVNTKSTVHLAQARVEILEDAFKRVRNLLDSKNLKF